MATAAPFQSQIRVTARRLISAALGSSDWCKGRVEDVRFPGPSILTAFASMEHGRIFAHDGRWVKECLCRVPTNVLDVNHCAGTRGSIINPCLDLSPSHIGQYLNIARHPLYFPSILACALNKTCTLRPCGSSSSRIHPF
jgi:hypothetical protein